MKQNLILSVLCLSLLASNASAASLKVCVDKAGNVIASASCTKGAKPLSTKNASALNLQGPMGPMGPIGPQGPMGPQGAQGPAGRDGLSIAACRIQVASAYSVEYGTVRTDLSCNTNEFLLTYGWWTEPIVLNVVRDTKPIVWNGVIAGVTILGQDDFGVPYDTPYTLYVAGTCCPR